MHISIGKPATETLVQHYECPKGHKIVAAAPITIGWYGNLGKPGGLGHPICPHCLVDFVRSQFPMAQVKAPERLPTSLPTPDGAPVILARPCRVEGCILMAHPSDEHMNAGHQMFAAPTA